MNIFRLFFSMFLLFAGFTACSNDIDNDSLIDDIAWSPDDNVLIELSLLNDKGQKCSVFKEQDAILFDLNIDNRSIAEVCIVDGFGDGSNLFFDKNFFCIYTAKGERINVPWSGMFCEYILNNKLSISAGTSYHIECPWRYGNYDNIGRFTTSFPLCKSIDNEDSSCPTLQKGKYYTEFVVKFKSTLTSNKLSEKKFHYNFKVE